jgi:hypothetical protein
MIAVGKAAEASRLGIAAIPKLHSFASGSPGCGMTTGSKEKRPAFQALIIRFHCCPFVVKPGDRNDRGELYYGDAYRKPT